MSQESPVLILRNASLEAEVPWELGVALSGLPGVVGGSSRGTVGKICCQIAVKRRNIPDTNTLKPPYKGLEPFGGPSILLGMPKGGFGIDCLWLFVAVLPVAPGAGSCSPTSVVVR
jgi:hypothetical protein